MRLLLKTTILLLFIVSNTGYSQKFKALDYSQLDKQGASTNLVIENKSPLSSIGKEHSHYDAYSFLQQYKEFSYSDKQNRFNQLEDLKRIVQPVSYANTIKIGVMHLEFDELKPSSIKDGLVTIENSKMKRASNEPIFDKKTSTLIAPFAVHKRGLHTSFHLDQSYMINNTDKDIVKIEIDFGNNEGFKTIRPDSYTNVDYQTEGEKTLTFKITLSNNEVITRTSPLKITASLNDVSNNGRLAPSEVTSTLVADLSSYAGATNHNGLAEYEVFLGADNVLDKPIFIIDGFDPSDTRTTTGIYGLLDFDNNGNVENLADTIRNDEDYDVVIINFQTYFLLADGSLQSMTNSTDVDASGVIDIADYPGSTLVDGGADFVERNALSVVGIIDLINSQKVGTEENVVIGPSMGGLISRYALNYMEGNSMNHETRLWLSFDSPHLGANVPIGFQHLFNYLAYGLDVWAGDFSMEALRPIVDGMLKSPAARQMLTDHYEPHLANGEISEFNPNLTLPIKHPYSTTFYTGINALTTSGFPETTRNVSLINGSGIGASYPHKNGDPVMPGDRVLDAFLQNAGPLTDAYMDVWYTGGVGQTVKISEIWIDAPWICFCDINADANSQSHSFSGGIDAAPGGLFDLGALAAGFGTADPTINAFFGSLTTNFFNFIPTVSAMALNTNANIDWFQNINLGPGSTPWSKTTTTNAQTPFVNWYMPDANEAHVTLTQANVEFTLDEILKKADISIKMSLQGAAMNPVAGEETLMRDDLRTGGYIPTTSPYSDNLTIDPTVLAATGADAIVDWVWMELRDEDDNTDIITSRSALLQRDGDVVDLDGLGSLEFEIPGRPYFVTINHRNHLGAMTRTAVGLSRKVTAVDFTTATGTPTFGTNAQIDMGSGAMALWAGDFNNDGMARFAGPSNDSNTLKNAIVNYGANTTGTSFFPYNGYDNLDLDLNGQVRFAGPSNDSNKLKNIIIGYALNTTGTGFFPIMEQLPN